MAKKAAKKAVKKAVKKAAKKTATKKAGAKKVAKKSKPAAKKIVKRKVRLTSSSLKSNLGKQAMKDGVGKDDKGLFAHDDVVTGVDQKDPV